VVGVDLYFPKEYRAQLEKNIGIHTPNVQGVALGKKVTRGERAFDIYSLLLRERIVMLNAPVNDEVSNLVIAQLLYLEREDAEKDISLCIHCPGSVISTGLAL
jgi:ATP-dependent Clp endopeptidase proteolytic subunit ClpP